MKTITIKGKIEFCNERNKAYDREFTATLKESPAFAYGNKTAVIIVWGTMANGITKEPELIDTRYDTTIRYNAEDFKKWIQNYFKEYFSEHILTIY